MDVFGIWKSYTSCIILRLFKSWTVAQRSFGKRYNSLGFFFEKCEFFWSVEFGLLVEMTDVLDRSWTFVVKNVNVIFFTFVTRRKIITKRWEKKQ